MRLRFLSPYRGKLTGEQFYHAGDEAEIEDIAAQRLVRIGVAVSVPPPTRADEPQITHSAEPDAPVLPRRSSKRKEATDEPA